MSETPLHPCYQCGAPQPLESLEWDPVLEFWECRDQEACEARGLVFKVPICETHFKMMPAEAQSGSSFLDGIMERARREKARR